MARNRIQFQKGLSEARLQALYGDEDKCRALVAAWRWPDGFVCPKCGGSAHCIVGPRKRRGQQKQQDCEGKFHGSILRGRGGAGQYGPGS